MFFPLITESKGLAALVNAEWDLTAETVSVCNVSDIF